MIAFTLLITLAGCVGPTATAPDTSEAEPNCPVAEDVEVLEIIPGSQIHAWAEPLEIQYAPNAQWVEFEPQLHADTAYVEVHADWDDSGLRDDMFQFWLMSDETWRPVAPGWHGTPGVTNVAPVTRAAMAGGMYAVVVYPYNGEPFGAAVALESFAVQITLREHACAPETLGGTESGMMDDPLLSIGPIEREPL